MKKIILVFLGVLVFITLNSQTISDGIIVHDTRLINDAANFTKKQSGLILKIELNLESLVLVLIQLT